MKQALALVLLVFGMVGCGDADNYIDIANNQSKPLLQFDRIFDCRSQHRTLWSKTHSLVIAHIINFSKGSEVLHKGRYKDTILESPWDYELSNIKSDEHDYEAFYYDVEIIEETESFIRFINIDKEGKKKTFVINKETLILSNTGIEKEIMENQEILDGFKQQFIKLNSFERPCKKI